jgi:predicted TPR repeat methyltransferase
MVAGIAALMGDDARALALFNEAVESEYQAQGGDGLLRFATFLEQRGDADGAERLLRLTIERDPESIFAATARTRLGGE